MLDARTLLLRAWRRHVVGLGTRLWQLNVREVVLAANTSLHDHAGVDAEEQHEAENDQNAEDADPAAASPSAAREADAAAWQRKAEAAAFVAPVLDVLA